MRQTALLFLFLLLMWSGVQAQSGQENERVSRHSVLLRPVQPVPVQPPAAATPDIPTIGFPEEARMPTWWPDDQFYYNMPNLLEPRIPVELKPVEGMPLWGDKRLFPKPQNG